MCMFVNECLVYVTVRMLMKQQNVKMYVTADVLYLSAIRREFLVNYDKQWSRPYSTICFKIGFKVHNIHAKCQLYKPWSNMIRSIVQRIY